jgi:tripartite-type tricarboxylate transporter receptor subunit TctC
LLLQSRPRCSIASAPAKTSRSACRSFASNWAAWFPKGTPPEIVTRMHGWLDQIVHSPEAKEFLAKNGADPLPNIVEGTQALIRSDYDTWANVAVVAKLEKQ